MSKRAKIAYQNFRPLVNEDGRLFEIDTTYPPITNDRQIILYVDDLTLNGDGVTTDMKVDGSVTTQDFFVRAEPDLDIFINSVSFFIAAETLVIDLFEFGATNGTLTNGCQLVYENSEEGEIIIGDSLNSNFELLRMCGMKPSLGVSLNNAFQIQKAFSNSDVGYLFILNFLTYGYESEYRGGIRLRAGSEDRLVFKIRDDLNLIPSELSSFDGRVYGFKRVI